MTTRSAVCRPDRPLPAALIEAAATGPDVISVTWTPDEVSIICPADRVPAGAVGRDAVALPAGRRPVDLALTGILASIVDPLADARVNIFAFSTYDTDYVLVPAVG